MEKLKFRPLRAEEIDVRVGAVDKDKKWISLLLYKDARVDMDLLDETVGPKNWKREHLRENANCIVGIWDDDKKEWVTKEDTGIESNTQEQKGLASDSFKRACVNWGIGRELYNSPKIFIYGDVNKIKYDNYFVKEIDHDEHGEIKKLIIANKKGAVVFSYPQGTNQTTKKENPINAEQIKKIHTLIGKNDALKEAIYKKFKVESCKNLTEKRAEEMIKILEEGINKSKKGQA